VLVGTNDGGIHMMGLPVEVAGSIGVFLHGGEDAVPDPGFLPAVEPGRHRGRWAIARGQVGPRRAGAQDPQNAVDDWSIIVTRAATLAPFGGAGCGEQRLQPGPLGVS
jgi:hypothetical protein